MNTVVVVGNPKPKSRTLETLQRAEVAIVAPLANVTAFPVMLGASPGHALAPELFLKPVLVELGATCPSPGLFLIDKTFAEDPRLDAWVERAWRHLPARRSG